LGAAASGQEASQEKYSSAVHGSQVAAHVVLGECLLLFNMTQVHSIPGCLLESVVGVFIVMMIVMIMLYYNNDKQ